MSGYVITLPQAASPLAHLAAKEVRRFVYCSTGHLAPILSVDQPPEDVSATEIRFSTTLPDRLAPAGAHFLRELQSHVIELGGRTPESMLDAAYTFAERCLRVRFVFSEEVIPRLAGPWTCSLPRSTRKLINVSPFKIRGLQPFHDFTSGPDWWSLDDYKHVLHTMRKQRFNAIGFHNYPQGPAHPAGAGEPMLWVGKASDLDADGNVRPSGAYPVSWRTTNDTGWGMVPRSPKDYVAGAALLFPTSCYGSPVNMADPRFCGIEKDSTDADSQAAVINLAGDLLASTTGFAHALGIQVVLGTETPLTVPDSSASVQQGYEGLFVRLQRKLASAGMVDTYWHWTTEAWATMPERGVRRSLPPDPRRLTLPF